MKKKRIMFIIGICGMCLSGCGKDPLSTQMIEQIKEIGTIELDDEPLISELEQTYLEMTDKQKNQVSNYVDLKNARKELDKIKVDMAKEEPYSTAITLCEAVKTNLTNPNDFILNSVEFYSTSEENTRIYKVDFSGAIGTNITRLKIINVFSDVGFEAYFENDDQYDIWDVYFDESSPFYNKDNPKESLNIDIIEQNMT